MLERCKIYCKYEYVYIQARLFIFDAKQLVTGWNFCSYHTFGIISHVLFFFHDETWFGDQSRSSGTPPDQKS